jgi:hypothetical protein
MEVEREDGNSEKDAGKTSQGERKKTVAFHHGCTWVT